MLRPAGGGCYPRSGVRARGAPASWAYDVGHIESSNGGSDLMASPELALASVDDAGPFRQGLRAARLRSGVPLVFAGLVRERALVLEQVVGDHSRRLRGLRVLPGRGLGGRVAETARPFAVDDYGTSTTITHHYDDAVLGEGIRSLLAAPVLVRGRLRGVLYAGVRSVAPLGEVAGSALVEISRTVATELAIRDEVERRLRDLEPDVTRPGSPLPQGGLDELHAELCGIATELDDVDLRRRVQAAAGRLAAWGAGGALPGAAAEDDRVPRLTRREIDVLAEVELGCSNAEAAARLALLPETVKAYLRSASRKLGVHGRYQAVLAARRLGLLAER